MKLTLFLLLVAINCKAQEWIKIRSIQNNNTVDEWVRKGSLDARTYLYTHDTIYVDSFRSQIFKAIAELQQYKKREDSIKFSGFRIIPSANITIDSNYSWGDFKIDKKGRIVHNIKRKHKKRYIPKRAIVYTKYNTYYKCIPDTIKGFLWFNNKIADEYYGNTMLPGYWIGCSHITNGHDDVKVIPSYYLKTKYYGNLRKFTSEPNGTFYTDDSVHIGNYRVYGLLISD